ncbi:hypothetical protein [Hymenobacter persicinus]|uniref:Uncharacterized protein n=1 Tax=Hymenobacter persicinus TaxID=2025506 RepID=A0A4Q5LH30_9BACT|nr:hypothetical protein [Hymenobacter persicinus]RYU81243.1 hypothetical protein EWM57_06610 [Hymenobacter persicinus]
MIKPIVQGVITTFSVAAKAGLAILLTLLIWTGTVVAWDELKFIIFSYRNLQGTWLARDRDEKEYGRMELLITQDSAFYGDRVFGDGNTQPFHRAETRHGGLDNYYLRGAIIHLTADSLILMYPNGRSQGWGVDLDLNGKTINLIGDSYSTLRFVKVADGRIAGHR